MSPPRIYHFEPKRCEQCGNEFTARPDEGARFCARRFCGPRCQGIASRGRVVVIGGLSAEQATERGFSYLPLINCASVALIDQADASWAADYEWRLHSAGYAQVSNGPQYKQFLHRIILKARPGEIVDHANGTRLDNRRENIRLVEKIHNQWNAHRTRTHRVGFKGVWPVTVQSWCAYIAARGSRHYLGCFASPEAAARAYDDAARQYFGEFARLNFPDDPSRAAIREPDEVTSRRGRRILAGEQ